MPKLLVMEFLTCTEADSRMHLLSDYLLWTFFGPVTLTLTRQPSYVNSTRTAWRYTRRATTNMNFLREVFRNLSSDRQTDRQTDKYTYIQTQSTKIIKHATSCECGLSSITLGIISLRWHTHISTKSENHGEKSKRT